MHWSSGQPITASGEHGGTVPCSRAPRPWQGAGLTPLPAGESGNANLPVIRRPTLTTPPRPPLVPLCFHTIKVMISNTLLPDTFNRNTNCTGELKLFSVSKRMGISIFSAYFIRHFSVVIILNIAKFQALHDDISLIIYKVQSKFTMHSVQIFAKILLAGESSCLYLCSLCSFEKYVLRHRIRVQRVHLETQARHAVVPEGEKHLAHLRTSFGLVCERYKTV